MTRQAFLLPLLRSHCTHPIITQRVNEKKRKPLKKVRKRVKNLTIYDILESPQPKQYQ